MYGTVARIKVKPSETENFLKLTQEWENDAGSVDGAIATYTYKLDNEPDTLIMSVVFRDKESYFANANDPAQDVWFQKLRVLMAADPVWEDGEIINSWTA
ncbi:MAG: antibiotic biosynthesis monooxygenase [Actinomycetota bacterium]